MPGESPRDWQEADFDSCRQRAGFQESRARAFEQGIQFLAHSKESHMDVEVVIEIPQGSRNKYEMDHKARRIRLDRMLFTSTRYPLDYGFIPGTLAEDGDPLDALVWLEEPTFPGCLVTVRPVAVFWMHDEHGPDAKILTVPAHDPRMAAIGDLASEIGHFFDVYKDLEPGKGSDPRGWQDRAAAEQVIGEAVLRAPSGGPLAGPR